MRLNSALEDLTNTTLGAVSGILAKLDYLSGLREGTSYVHWGLATVYGQKAAQEALAQAHHFVFAEVLRTPLRDLAEDLAECSTRIGLNSSDYLNKLSSSSHKLVPGHAGAGSAQHFSSVLYALSNLQRNPRAAIPPIS